MARSRAELEKLLSNPGDIPSLTDQQLQDYLAANTEYQGIHEQQPQFQTDKFNQDLSGFLDNQISNALDKFSKSQSSSRFKLPTPQITDLAKEDAKNYAVQTLQNGTYDPQQFANILITKSPNATALFDSGDIQNIGKSIGSTYAPQVQSYFTPAPVPLNDYSQNVQTVQGLVDQRGFQGDQQKALDNFFTQSPEQVQAARDQFFQGQQSRAKDYITNEFAPYAIEQLGARGLADSGEVGSAIAGKYGEIQSSIEQEQAAQQASDLQFYSDLAYKSTLQDLVNQRTDITGQLAYQTQLGQQRQQQSFQSSQANIERNFNLDLFKQQQDAALSQYQQQLKRQSDSQNNALLAGIVKTGVTGLGAYFGGPVGAVAASTATSAIG